MNKSDLFLIFTLGFMWKQFWKKVWGNSWTKYLIPWTRRKKLKNKFPFSFSTNKTAVVYFPMVFIVSVCDIIYEIICRIWLSQEYLLYVAASFLLFHLIREIRPRSVLLDAAYFTFLLPQELFHLHIWKLSNYNLDE